MDSNSLNINTLTVDTITGHSLNVNKIAVGTITGNSINASSINAHTMFILGKDILNDINEIQQNFNYLLDFLIVKGIIKNNKEFEDYVSSVKLINKMVDNK